MNTFSTWHFLEFSHIRKLVYRPHYLASDFILLGLICRLPNSTENSSLGATTFLLLTARATWVGWDPGAQGAGLEVEGDLGIASGGCARCDWLMAQSPRTEQGPLNTGAQ